MKLISGSQCEIILFRPKPVQDDESQDNLSAEAPEVENSSSLNDDDVTDASVSRIKRMLSSDSSDRCASGCFGSFYFELSFQCRNIVLQ